jgi:proteic killer suppression protein
MDVRFDEKYLEELYLTGKTNDKKHRFQPSVVQNYQHCIEVIKDASNVQGLKEHKSMHVEKLSGKKKRNILITRR